MPQEPRVQPRPQLRPQPRRRRGSGYVALPVGQGVLLECKRAPDGGGPIVRLSRTDDGRTPRPGKWIRLADLRVDQLAEELGDLEAGQMPTAPPFRGKICVEQILIEGVEDALDPMAEAKAIEAKAKAKAKAIEARAQARAKDIEAKAQAKAQAIEAEAKAKAKAIEAEAKAIEARAQAQARVRTKAIQVQARALLMALFQQL